MPDRPGPGMATDPTGDDVPDLAPDVAAAGGRPLLVGLSGGLDSTVLLHLLAGDPAIRGQGLRALHVHHGLQPQADAWARHCRDLCAAWSVPLEVVHVAVEAGASDGPEAAARRARHAAFGQAMADDEVLVLAHHRDDQAETFLLRALRASGSRGLGAMRAWRRFDPGWLWRPLLHAPRARLLAHARHHGLDWIEDPSNQDAALDRNFLRHHVMPLLRSRWPGVDAAFARSARLAAADDQLLQSQDVQAMARVGTDDRQVLSLPALRTLSPNLRARVLRHWIAGLGLPPLPATGLARIEADLLAARGDARAAFAWNGAIVHAWRDLLHAGRQLPPLPGDWRAPWDGLAPLHLPTGDSLELLDGSPVGGFGETLQVRARQGGERITLPGRQHSHALKHVLQDRGVPPWERARLPLLVDADDSVLAVGDVACSARFEDWLGSRGARLSWRRSQS